jgi:hypothetical protein
MLSPRADLFIDVVIWLDDNIAVITRDLKNLTSPSCCVPTMLPRLSRPGCPVTVVLSYGPVPAGHPVPLVLSMLTCPGLYSMSGQPVRLTCPAILCVYGCPAIVVLSRLSCISRLVLAALKSPFCHGCPAMVVFSSQLSCPGCPVPTVLSCCLVPSVLLSCPGYMSDLVLAVMSLKSSSARHFLSVRSGILHRLTCPSCPVPITLPWQSSLGYPATVVLSWLFHPGCSIPVVLSRLSCPGYPVLAVLSLFLSRFFVPAVLSLLSCSGRPLHSARCPFPFAMSRLSFHGCRTKVFLSRLSCPGISVLSCFGHPVVSFL